MQRFLLLLLFLASNGLAQQKPAYKIFSKEGHDVDFEKMILELRSSDVVLFGELHDNAIDHWLELQVLKDVNAQRSDVVIGMEMFEADDQIILTEYLNGTIDERNFLDEAKIWNNYKNDYKPLIEFAREKKLPVIATNVPRRYANVVYKRGINALDQLPEEAKRWIAPLPVEVDLSLPGYKEMVTMGGHGTTGSAENMATSQALKDATMAHFILKNRKGLFLHFNGTYHSKNYEGISWYLKKADSKLKIITIHSVEQESLQQLEGINKNSADFIICTPKDMTKTF